MKGKHGEIRAQFIKQNVSHTCTQNIYTKL